MFSVNSLSESVIYIFIKMLEKFKVRCVCSFTFQGSLRRNFPDNSKNIRVVRYHIV